MTCTVANNGAFLHIPKTGGTWVYKVLESAELVHGIINDEHHPGHNERWAFTVVRHPAKWWVSLWRHQMEHRWENYAGHHVLYEINGAIEHDIQRWLNMAATQFAGLCGRVYEQYTRNAKYVLKTEEMRWQLRILAKTVGWPELNTSMPNANVSTHPVSAYLDFNALYKAESQAMDIWRSAGLEPEANFTI